HSWRCPAIPASSAGPMCAVSTAEKSGSSYGSSDGVASGFCADSRVWCIPHSYRIFRPVDCYTQILQCCTVKVRRDQSPSPLGGVEGPASCDGRTAPL